jgi:hypothetical protein
MIQENNSEKQENVENTLKDVKVNAPILPLRNPVVVTSFLRQNQHLVSDYFLKALKFAILKDLPQIVLFRLGESDMIAVATIDSYEEYLNKLKEFYVSEQEFEKAAICNKLVVRLNINRLIKGSIM